MNIKKVKLFLIILLALLSVTGVFVALIPAVYADTSEQAESSFGGGNGTSTNPYQISSIDHMEQLAADVNSGITYQGKYFKLMNNITYGEGLGTVDVSQEILTPIGTSANPFSGTFDGNNNYIINPMTYIINAYRDIFYVHQLPNISSLSILLLISLFALVLCYKIFKKLEKRFAEEI